jgi:cell division protein FtsI (penicillin-binding protein 3)
MPSTTGGTFGRSGTAAAPSAEQAGYRRVRASVVHVLLVLFAAGIVARAAQLQLVEHARWARVADEQHVREVTIEPPRGAIIDATGNVLAETREQVTLTVASHELRSFVRKRPGGKKDTIDGRAFVRAELRALQVPDSTIRRVLAKRRQWIPLRRKFLAADVERFIGVPGVYRERELRRVVSVPPGLRGLVGSLNAEGEPVSGIELELDPFLRGEQGSDPVVVAGSGERIGSPMLTPIAARPGHTVTLTINQSLQEIAERELALALERTQASGGDVVMLDPRDGALLALAAVRNGKPAGTSTPIAEPYEPGSVM